MMFAMPVGLGLIPDWQFSPDPAINIAINPHVKIPSDWPMGQRTVQPIGLQGLGITMASWQQPRADLGAVNIGLFDGWAWRNRKWLVLGGVGLLGLAALSGVGALLR
jgi:hypothetical protein